MSKAACLKIKGSDPFAAIAEIDVLAEQISFSTAGLMPVSWVWLGPAVSPVLLQLARFHASFAPHLSPMERPARTL